MEKPDKSCANCHSQSKTKLCHCESIYICDAEGWKTYCENNSEFKTKCQLAKCRLQMKVLEAQQKSAAGKKRQTPRGDDGRFANLPSTAGSQRNNKSTKEKTDEQKLKDKIASKASTKKRVAVKFLKKYCKLVPANKLFVREVKKKGKAEVWFQSPGYNPLQSRLPSENPATEMISGVPIHEHENSAPHEDVNEENSSGDSGRNTTESSDDGPPSPPNIENIPQEAIIQERTKINLKQFCGICNQGIGIITNPFSVATLFNFTLRQASEGLYPTSDTDRKIIQKSYFCPDHRPEADEASEEGVQSTSNMSPDVTKKAESASSKAKTRKRKASKDPPSDLSTPVAPKRSSTAAPKRKSAASSKQVSKPKPGVPDGYSTPHSEMSSYSPSVNTPQISEVAKSILPMLPEYSPYPTATESSSNGFVTLTPSTSWGVNGVTNINGYQINENELNQSTSSSSTTLGGTSLLSFTNY